MTGNLKPCPFCGGKAITSTFFDLDDLDYMVFEVNDSESIDGEVTCENEHCINGWWLSQKEWNSRPIEDELNRRIAKAKDLLNAEMGVWRSVPTGDLPDHFIQLRQVLDVLDGGGE